MKTDIIIAGVGGQGILTIAAALGTAALNNNLNIKQSEVHGMSQRGGSVISNFRISDKEIYSDLVPFKGANVVISLEPMEALRYSSFLAEDGWLVSNITTYENIKGYPEFEEIKKTIETIKNHILIDADKIAKEAGSSRSTNVVMLGAGSWFIDIPADEIEKAIAEIFKSKGEKIINGNIAAFRAGREIAKTFIS